MLYLWLLHGATVMEQSRQPFFDLACRPARTEFDEVISSELDPNQLDAAWPHKSKITSIHLSVAGQEGKEDIEYSWTSKAG